MRRRQQRQEQLQEQRQEQRREQRRERQREQRQRGALRFRIYWLRVLLRLYSVTDRSLAPTTRSTSSAVTKDTKKNPT